MIRNKTNYEVYRKINWSIKGIPGNRQKKDNCYEYQRDGIWLAEHVPESFEDIKTATIVVGVKMSIFLISRH